MKVDIKLVNKEAIGTNNGHTGDLVQHTGIFFH